MKSIINGSVAIIATGFTIALAVAAITLGVWVISGTNAWVTKFI